MTTLANLIVRLSADTSSYQVNLKAAQKSLNIWGRQMETTGVFLTKTLTVPIVATAGSLAYMAKSTATTGDMLHKLSQRTGVSVERLSAYRLAAALSDTTMEDLGSNLGRLSKKMFDVQTGSKEARTGFDTLGISVFDSNGQLRSSEEVMLNIADKFSKMQDGTLKTALAMEIFGKSGASMIPFLNQSSEGLRKTMEESLKLGAVWNAQSTPAAVEFNHKLTKLGFAFQTLKERIGGLVVKHFKDDLDSLNKSMENSKGFDKLIGRLDALMGRFDKLPTSTKLKVLGGVGAAVALPVGIAVAGNLIRNSKEVLGLAGRLFPVTAGIAALVGGFKLGKVIDKSLHGEGGLAEKLFPTPLKGPRGVQVGETSAPGAGRQLIPLTHIEKIGGFNVLKPTKRFVPLPGGMPGEGDWRQQFVEPSAFTKEGKVTPFPEFTKGASVFSNTLLDSKVFQTFERMLSVLEKIESSVAGGGKETTTIISP